MCESGAYRARAAACSRAWSLLSDRLGTVCTQRRLQLSHLLPEKLRTVEKVVKWRSRILRQVPLYDAKLTVTKRQQH